MNDTPTIKTAARRAALPTHPEPATRVISGNGDLTHRKLGTALYNLQRERMLHPASRIGFAGATERTSP